MLVSVSSITALGRYEKKNAALQSDGMGFAKIFSKCRNSNRQQREVSPANKLSVP
jgi:hypothetical protein